VMYFDIWNGIINKKKLEASNVFSFVHSSMAVQLFVEPWPLLQFRNLFYTDGRTPWTSDQPVARPLPTHRTTQTQNKRSHDIHALNGIRNHDPSVGEIENSSCVRPRGHCDLIKGVYVYIHKYKHPCVFT
jgi:hypothetical protein